MIRLLRASRNGYRGLRALHYSSESPIDVSPEIQDALQSATRRPVVALETALVTHGLPHPINLETALSIESKVRSVGAIPATIGLLDGRIKVGLTRAQLERLADIKGNPGLVKVSRRDIAAAVGLRLSGGTTISGTSIIASFMGIRIFATGGLGGVHRGGEISWDVSADLTELGRTPIAVVSAGVKSILDIPRTLEYLETHGVAVFTYGPTNEFPGFFSPVTDHESPWRVNSPESAARIIHAGECLRLNSGMLFAAPIPAKYAEASRFIQDAVEKAVKESEENGMSKRGKDVTPWLLARVTELTQGRSITSNIALLENTAVIGGKIAVEYAKLQNEVNKQQETVHLTQERHLSKKLCEDYTSGAESGDSLPPASLLVIGAAAVDITSQPHKGSHSKSTSFQSTTPGRVSISLGGVARNIAEAAHRILSTSAKRQSHSVLLVSPFGNDLFANLVRDDAQRLSMRTDGFLSGPDPNQISAICNMHLDADGNLATGVADMSIVHSIDAQPIIEIIEKHHPSVVSFDANLNPDVIAKLVRFCGERNLPTFFEPTSVVKSTSILSALELMNDTQFNLAPITFASPNLLELSHIFHEVQSSPQELMNKPHWWSVVDGLRLGEQYRTDLALLSRQPVSTFTGETLSFLVNGAAQMAVSLLPFFQHLFVKCGEKGIFVAMRLVGEAALSGGWSLERTQLENHQVVAKGKDGIFVLKHYPAIHLDPGDIVNVTGAGDSLVGALLSGLIRAGTLDSPENMDRLIRRAQHASMLSLRSVNAVSSLLTDSRIDDIQ